MTVIIVVLWVERGAHLVFAAQLFGSNLLTFSMPSDYQAFKQNIPPCDGALQVSCSMLCRTLCGHRLSVNEAHIAGSTATTSAVQNMCLWRLLIASRTAPWMLLRQK